MLLNCAQVGSGVTAKVQGVDQRLARVEKQMDDVAHTVDSLLAATASAPARSAAGRQLATAAARRSGGGQSTVVSAVVSRAGSVPASLRESVVASQRASVAGSRASGPRIAPSSTAEPSPELLGTLQAAIGQVREAQRSFERSVQSQLQEVRQLLRERAAPSPPPSIAPPATMSEEQANELLASSAEMKALLLQLRAVPTPGAGPGFPALVTAQSAPVVAAPVALPAAQIGRAHV